MGARERERDITDESQRECEGFLNLKKKLLMTVCAEEWRVR